MTSRNQFDNKFYSHKLYTFRCNGCIQQNCMNGILLHVNMSCRYWLFKWKDNTVFNQNISSYHISTYHFTKKYVFKISAIIHNNQIFNHEQPHFFVASHLSTFKLENETQTEKWHDGRQIYHLKMKYEPEKMFKCRVI